MKIIQLICLFYCLSTIHCNLRSFSKHLQGEYQVSEIIDYRDRQSVILKFKQQNSHFLYKVQNQICKNLEVIFSLQSVTEIEIKILDQIEKRFEIPETYPFPHNRKFWLNQTNSFSQNLELTKFKLEIQNNPFGFKLYRKDTMEAIFTLLPGQLIYSQYFLQVATKLPSKQIYGWGQRWGKFGLEEGIYTINNIDTVGVWGFDHQADHGKGHSGYGSHPMYLLREKSHNFHIMYSRNSHLQELEINKKQTYWRSIGGIIDFKFFLGNHYPITAIKQYHSYIGDSMIPPFWVMGHHHSSFILSILFNQGWKWGENIHNYFEYVVNTYDNYKIPIDVMWGDIGVLDQGIENFQINKQAFPKKETDTFLQEQEIKFIVIVEPVIKNDPSFFGYKEGTKTKIFVKNQDNSEAYVGDQWPGKSMWIDYFNPDAKHFLFYALKHLKKTIHIDGIWLDMNEMANNCGDHCSASNYSQITPYSIPNQELENKALPFTTLHYNNIADYHLHNLNSLKQVQLHYEVLKENFHNGQPFILSRSTSAGSGQFTATWAGDSQSTWEYLQLLISYIFHSQLFGLTTSGDDICGFDGTPGTELCARWIQVASLSPFFRNHKNNDEISSPQEFFVKTQDVIKTARSSLQLRYSLAKYYYSLYFSKQTNFIYSPLFYHFPDDEKLYEESILTSQFMIGEELLAIPIISPFVYTIEGYFPTGIWYKWQSNEYVKSPDMIGTKSFNVRSQLGNTIPLFLREGKLVPYQHSKNVKRILHLDNTFSIIAGMKLLPQTEYNEYSYISTGKVLALTNYSQPSVIEKCQKSSIDCLMKIIVKLKLQKTGNNVLDAQVNVEFNGGDYFEELKFSYLKLYFTFDNTPLINELEDLEFLEDYLVSNVLLLPIGQDDQIINKKQIVFKGSNAIKYKNQNENTIALTKIV